MLRDLREEPRHVPPVGRDLAREEVELRVGDLVAEPVGVDEREEEGRDEEERRERRTPPRAAGPTGRARRASGRDGARPARGAARAARRGRGARPRRPRRSTSRAPSPRPTRPSPSRASRPRSRAGAPATLFAGSRNGLRPVPRAFGPVPAGDRSRRARAPRGAPPRGATRSSPAATTPSAAAVTPRAPRSRRAAPGRPGSSRRRRQPPPHAEHLRRRPFRRLLPEEPEREPSVSRTRLSSSVSSGSAPSRLPELLPVGAEDEREVRVRGRRQAERPLERDLPRRRRQEVASADDLRDALRRVVDDDGELVGERAVGAPHDEVAHRAGDLLLDPPPDPVLEGRSSRPGPGNGPRARRAPARAPRGTSRRRPLPRRRPGRRRRAHPRPARPPPACSRSRRRAPPPGAARAPPRRARSAPTGRRPRRPT